MLSQDSWKIDANGDVDFPKMLYAEGIGTGAETVTLSLVDTSNRVRVTDVIKINVEAIVWPFANHTSFRFLVKILGPILEVVWVSSTICRA